MKHKVVNLILIYFNTNNAFYKIEHITYSCELIYKYELNIIVNTSSDSYRELCLTQDLSVVSIVQLIPVIGTNWTQWRKLNAYNKRTNPKIGFFFFSIWGLPFGENLFFWSPSMIYISHVFNTHITLYVFMHYWNKILQS